MVPPPAKRARRDGLAALIVSGGGSRRVTTRSQKPRLSTELLAKISTFSSLGGDLLNLCIVAGPKDCVIVRHSYLRGDHSYLRHFLRKYVDDKIDARKCRDCYRAWMEVNDWRELVTDEGIEALSSPYNRDSRGRHVTLDPHIPFNNPSVAIEIGLIEALQYLVEQKNIDVNAYNWSNYRSEQIGEKSHLLTECILMKNHEAFQYILGRGDIDVDVRAVNSNRSCSVFEIVCRQSRYDGPFFQSFIDSSNFGEESTISDHACNTYIPVLHWLTIFAIVSSAEVWFDLPTWKSNFKFLLNAGANPNRSSEAGSAIQYAKFMLIRHPEHHEAMEYAIEILEKWGKKK